ncbi:unnamed protein product [Rhizoctonia solani]|nr:unnamed protein product [Rhizoctonia solani]
MSLSIDPLVLEDMTSLIMSQFVQLSRKLLFKQPSGSVSFDTGLLWRIGYSDFTRWSMYLSARVLNDISNGINGQKYIGCIFRFCQRILESATSTESTKAMEGRLGGLHDMTYLGFIVSGIAFGYSLFQQSAPTFLRLAALDSDLWSDNSTILISKAIRSWYEVSRFVAHDTLIAFILGVPPLLHYETSTPWSGDEQSNHIIELSYGIPTEVLCHLAKINAWRASRLMGETIQSQNGWRDMEALLKNGSSAIDHTDDPIKDIARFAIQETWRQVTLIYFYMGMRDVNSADPRVEAAVQQVVQLGNTIEPGSALELHTLIPCVIAGAAARQEKHRASLRTKIASRSRYGVTLVLRTSEFAAVLDHLWHGAGAEGKPTTWEDYVQSRCVVLPVAC